MRAFIYWTCASTRAGCALACCVVLATVHTHTYELCHHVCRVSLTLQPSRRIDRRAACSAHCSRLDGEWGYVLQLTNRCVTAAREIALLHTCGSMHVATVICHIAKLVGEVSGQANRRGRRQQRSKAPMRWLPRAVVQGNTPAYERHTAAGPGTRVCRAPAKCDGQAP